MITLDLTPKIEWLLTQQAQQSGLSVRALFNQSYQCISQSIV